MLEINYSLIIVVVIAVILGFLYCYINCKKTSEAMTTMGSMGKHCPNVLIQDGSGIYLKNNMLADIPGINPIRFNNLEEYTEFYNWQKSQGIDCPVLFLQKTYNAQSDPVFKFRPDIFNPEGGLNADNNDNQLLLDSNRNNPPYNEDSYPGFDPDNQYIGAVTPLDSVATSRANAMLANWEGVEASEGAVKSGEFVQDEVLVKQNNNY